MISPQITYPTQELKLIREGKSWVLIPELTSESFGLLRKRLSQADLLVADLDDTDAPSPAKEIAKRFLMKREGAVNPKFWAWGLKTGLAFLQDGQKAESCAWENFLANFRENGEVLKIINQFTPQSARQISYPGVGEFYQNLSCPKVYLTRNVAKVANAFARTFGFSQIFAEEFDKKRALSQVCQAYPLARTFIVRGDSFEDAEIVQLLEDKKRQGEIEDVVSICVCQELKQAAFLADIYTSRDQTLLAKIFK